MDWGLLNAIGITVMAALGLWLLQRECNSLGKKRQKRQ